MAETKDSSLSQNDLNDGDKESLRRFGEWLREEKTQFDATPAGVKHCTDSNLQEKARVLFGSLNCLAQASVTPIFKFH